MRRNFRLLVDTCVWIDLVKRHKQLPLLDVLENLINAGVVELILPQIVFDEFESLKPRVLREATQGVSSILQRARAFVERLADENAKAAALAQLDEVDYRIPRLRESAIESLARIEALFVRCGITETSDEVLLAAADRAIRRVAPFHRSKNNMADAVILETYLQALGAAGGVGFRFAFVTLNKNDFIDPTGDNRQPHPDLASVFTRIKSLYFITLAAALQRIEPGAVAEAEFEQNWHEETRGLSELVEALDELVEKLWYGRHQTLAEAIEDGRTRVVEQGEEIGPAGVPATYSQQRLGRCAEGGAYDRRAARPGYTRSLEQFWVGPAERQGVRIALGLG